MQLHSYSLQIYIVCVKLQNLQGRPQDEDISFYTGFSTLTINNLLHDISIPILLFIDRIYILLLPPLPKI